MLRSSDCRRAPELTNDLPYLQIFGYYKSRQFKWNGNDYYQVGSLTEDGFVYAFDDTLGYALINP